MQQLAECLLLTIPYLLFSNIERRHNTEEFNRILTYSHVVFAFHTSNGQIQKPDHAHNERQFINVCDIIHVTCPVAILNLSWKRCRLSKPPVCIVVFITINKERT